MSVACVQDTKRRKTETEKYRDVVIVYLPLERTFPKSPEYSKNRSTFENKQAYKNRLGHVPRFLFFYLKKNNGSGEAKIRMMRTDDARLDLTFDFFSLFLF